MSTMQIRMANPSVSLPTDGRVLGMPACAPSDTRVFGTRVSGAIWGTTAERVRKASLVIDAHTTDAFPGTPAWSPPTS
jgi:hypothetical protein